jgi:hypothetical protein
MRRVLDTERCWQTQGHDGYRVSTEGRPVTARATSGLGRDSLGVTRDVVVTQVAEEVGMDAVFRSSNWGVRRAVALCVCLMAIALLAGAAAGSLLKVSMTPGVTHTTSRTVVAPSPEPAPMPLSALSGFDGS